MRPPAGVCGSWFPCKDRPARARSLAEAQFICPSKLDHEPPLTDTASETVDRYGPKGRSPFVLDPTSGALVVWPEADVIICKTLRREARRIAFGLRLRQPLFEIRYLFLKARWQRQHSGGVTAALSSGH